MACAVALGIPAVGWIASQQTLLQKSVADEYLGRVFGAFSATTALMLFVGSLSAAPWETSPASYRSSSCQPPYTAPPP